MNAGRSARHQGVRESLTLPRGSSWLRTSLGNGAPRLATAVASPFSFGRPPQEREKKKLCGDNDLEKKQKPLSVAVKTLTQNYILDKSCETWLNKVLFKIKQEKNIFH